MSIRAFKRKIGIVGLANAGKTVFMVSLINHLKNHDPEKLRLKAWERNTVTEFLFGAAEKIPEIRRFKRLDVEDVEQFNYAKHRDIMITEGRWPNKTTDSSHFRCCFERTDWAFTDIDFHFFDFPGERIADACMSGDYEAWSDNILRGFDSDSSYRKHSANFAQLLEQRDLEESEVIYQYKITLANLALDYKPFISPSTFLLDPYGSQAMVDLPGNIAEHRSSGLKNKQFAPLSKKARENNPGLVEKFTQRYREYREKVVSPIFTSLKDCHRLIILVDIQEILASGTGMYDDLRQIVQDLLQICSPGRSFWGKFGMAAATIFLPESWRPTGISRICFVATKSDQIYPADTDKLRSLLRQMVGPLVRNWEYDIRKVDYITCSAIRSTKYLKGTKQLVGKLLYDEEGNERTPQDCKLKFTTSELPECWEEEWPANQYTFPEVYPTIPKRKDIAPQQDGLEKIIDFIMEEEWTE